MTTEDCGNPPNAQEPQAELSLCATLQTVELTVMQSPIGPGAHPPGPPGSEAEASPKGIVLSHDHDFVAVDFIGGDGAKGSIPCLEDDDRDHERGGEGSGESVSIFAGHLFGSCLGSGGPSPARQDPAAPKTG